MSRRTRRCRGVSLVEAMLASTLTAITLTTALSLYIVGLMAWYRGEGNIDAESTSHTAIRLVANELRQAMSVTVDGNGSGLTYYLPQKDGNGTNIVPEVSDGVTRRIELDGTTINMIANGQTRKVCPNVILTDPLSPGGTGAYQIFVAGAGTTTRSVTIMVVTQRPGYGAELVTSRNRETVYLRNVPQLNN